jgi:SAM-dependent methyltransferase
MRVLDVGCGVGRFALPLLDYIDASHGGSFDGFDILREGILWCQSTITARYPHFRFIHVDLFNPHYNAAGKLDARTFRFPYADGSFDFVLLSSVFTHLLPDEVDHYLSEIARTTAVGGRTYITWFLRTPESLAGVAAGRARLDIRHHQGRFAVMDPDLPQKAIAYDEEWVLERYRGHGFRVVTPVTYGKWSGCQGRDSFQDIVIADRA